MSDSTTQDPGLLQAIERSGGQSALGRIIKRPQSTISDWLKAGKPLPAEYVLPVEAATGLSRHVLRPDIYPAEPIAPVVHSPLPHTAQSARHPAPLGEAAR